jgi:predicted RNA-binding Zn ribbon-like protein
MVMMVSMTDPTLQTALELVNTLEHSRDGDIEHLPDPRALVAWLVAHGLLAGHDADGQRSGHAGDAPSGAQALTAARQLRTALRGLVDARVAGRVPEGRHLEVVNRWLRRRAPLVLANGADGLVLMAAGDRDRVRDALAGLAEAAARGLASEDPARLRVCANDECRWAFHDTSRAGRRKWCDMSSCGNRAKARRHRERQAAAQAPPGGSSRAR